MNPVITILEDIAAGLDVERQSVELHLAVGHIGDGHGNFLESEKWSADTARFLLPYARALTSNRVLRASSESDGSYASP
jgi:hypothetical protein